MDEQLGRVQTGRNLGRTRASVYHMVMKNHSKETDVFVSEPTSLQVYLSPISGDVSQSDITQRPTLNGDWVIAEGSEYILIISVLDADGQCMHGENFEFEVDMLNEAGLTSKGEGSETSVKVVEAQLMLKRGSDLCSEYFVRLQAGSAGQVNGNGLTRAQVTLKPVAIADEEGCVYHHGLPPVLRGIRVTPAITLPTHGANVLFPFRAKKNPFFATLGPHVVELNAQVHIYICITSRTTRINLNNPK